MWKETLDLLLDGEDSVSVGYCEHVQSVVTTPDVLLFSTMMEVGWLGSVLCAVSAVLV